MYSQPCARVRSLASQILQNKLLEYLVSRATITDGPAETAVAEGAKAQAASPTKGDETEGAKPEAAKPKAPRKRKAASKDQEPQGEEEG